MAQEIQKRLQPCVRFAEPHDGRGTLGARTGTPVYVIREQRIVDLTKEDRAQARLSVKSRATRTRVA